MRLNKKLFLSLVVFAISASSVLANPAIQTSNNLETSFENDMEVVIDLSNVEPGQEVILSDGLS